MTTTPNLGITELTTNQTGKTIDINNGFVKLDNATQGGLATVFTANERTLTPAEFTGAVCFSCDTVSATGTLTVPLSRRMFVVDNRANPTHGIIVKGTTGGTVTVDGGVVAQLYNDGATIVAVAALSVGGGAVASFNSRTGAVVLTAADFLGLDLSGAPVSDPGSGKPWLNGGVLQVGA